MIEDIMPIVISLAVKITEKWRECLSESKPSNEMSISYG